jgi:phage protein D/phage baseplate assembly protein gpV
MPAEALIPQFNLTINGQPASPELMLDLIEITVDDSLYMPDMLTMCLNDPLLNWVDSELLVVGAQVQIKVTAAIHSEQSSSTDDLFNGEITALEPTFSHDGMSTLLVRGYDRSHRLHRGKFSRSFLNSTDSEIAQRVAREANLQAQVDATNVVHEYVFQDNQTNLEFLHARAQRIGFELYVKDSTLYFTNRQQKQSSDRNTAGIVLDWGSNLLEFRPRLTTMTQVDEVIVRGWDPKLKTSIVGRAVKGQISPVVGISQSGSALSKQAFGVSAQAVVVDRPVKSQDEASVMAQALCDEISGDFIQAEGSAFGTPLIQAGRLIKVTGVGNRFSGVYFVTSATHTYDQDGYQTRFDISGRQPGTLLNLLTQSGGAGGWGMVIGLVTNNKDPENLGRIKVKFPWMSDTDESTWARIAMPMGGKDKGFFSLPEINDEVLLSFEHGDINHPYVIGTLWNGKDKPPRSNSQVVGGDGKVNQQILRSRSGHEVILDDTAGKEKITISDKAGNIIEFDAVKNTITLTSKANINIEAKGKLSIKGAQVAIEGTTVSIEADAKVDVKGAIINLN